MDGAYLAFAQDYKIALSGGVEGCKELQRCPPPLELFRLWAFFGAQSPSATPKLHDWQQKLLSEDFLAGC